MKTKSIFRIVCCIIIVKTNFVFGGNPVYPMPEHLFVNEGKTDFEKIKKVNDEQLKNVVLTFFNEDQLNHEMTKAYDANASFDKYWSNFQKYWFFTDLNKDGINELIFNNTKHGGEYNFVEIYIQSNSKFKIIYSEKGSFVFYKINPNTNEIVLFKHEFPCCTNLSHNIDMVRLLHGKIKLRKKYLIARPDNMKTKLFPKKVKYNSSYQKLGKEIELYWSAEVIDKEACPIANKNRVCKYAKGSVYKLLGKEKGWKYVLMCSAPISNSSNVLNTANFEFTHVFGWIKD